MASPNARRPRLWLLEETGVPYELVRIDIHDPSQPRDPEFAQASPMGKAPALADGVARLADSAALCMYVADRYPQTNLAPPIGDPLRARYLWWMVFTPGVIEPAMSGKFSGAAANRLRSGGGDFELMIETLAKGVTPGPWLLNERFSAADIMCGSFVVFMQQFGMLPGSDALENYAARRLARPAYQRALEIDAKG